MAGLSLKEGVRLNADSTGAVLVDTDLCRTIRLSPHEAKILQLCDGKRSPEEILVESRKSDKSLDLARVQDVLSHLEQEGFLQDPTELSDVEIEVDLNAEPQMSNPPPSPEAPLLSDFVPRLRADLQIQKKPTGELGLLDVTDPRSGRTFTLYDFEVSIARMLNGERKIVEVIEAAAKIGIPVTLESFQKFIRQIKAYGFIDEVKPPDEAPDKEPQTTWEPRQEWSAEIRQLFQSALKMFRLKRFSEAKNYADAILAIDPKIVEAREMLQRIEGGNSLEAVVAAAETTPEVPEAPPNFEDLYGPAVPSKEETPPREYRTRTAERAAHRAGQRRARLIAAAVVAVAAGVAALYPMRRVLQVDARITPIYDVPLRSPRAGTVRALFVHDRQWVTPGTRLFELDARSALLRLETVEKNLQKVSEELKELQGRKQSEDFKRLVASIEALKSDLDTLRSQRESLVSKRQASKVGRLNKRIRAAEGSLQQAEDEVQRMVPPSKEPELTQLVQKGEMEKEKLKKEVDSAAIVAPHEGIVVSLPEAKSDVVAGQILARIQDISLLKATLKVAEGDAHFLESEQPLSLSVANLPRMEFKGQVSKVADPEQTEGRFEGIVKNPEKLSLDPTGRVTIQCGKQSFGQLLVQRMKRLTMPSLHAALR